MRKIFNINSIFLVVAGIIFAIPVFACANTFNFYDGLDDIKHSEKYYYSDRYFLEDSDSYNNHLSSLSLALSISTFQSRSCSFAKEILENSGFSDIKCDDIENVSKDTIGSVIASKKINDYILIPVVIRGGKYEKEWESNFIFGNGDMTGFSLARDKIIKRINDYINNNKIEKYKLWIMGYSRAGAVANLTGKYINDNIEKFKIDENDLFVYTFESPKSSIENKKYKNIYNISNGSDLITKVYPSSWNFYENGTLIDITSNKNITLKKIKLLGFDIIDYKTILLSDFLDEAINSLLNGINNDYSNNYEKSIIKILDMYFNDEIDISFFNKLKDSISNIIKENSISFLFDYASGNTEKVFRTLKDEMIKETRNILKDNNSKLKDIDSFTKDFSNILDLMINIIKNDFNSNSLKDDDGNLNFTRILTIYSNFYDIIKEHSAYNTFNIVSSLDSFYDGCSAINLEKKDDIYIKVNDCKYMVSSIFIDDKKLEETFYDIDDDIIIHKDYLKKLENGEYNIVIEFQNGKSELSFTVDKSNNFVFYIFTFGIFTTFVILFLIVLYDKKRVK